MLQQDEKTGLFYDILQVKANLPSLIKGGDHTPINQAVIIVSTLPILWMGNIQVYSLWTNSIRECLDYFDQKKKEVSNA